MSQADNDKLAPAGASNRRRRRAVVCSAAALLLLCIAIIAWWAYKARQKPPEYHIAEEIGHKIQGEEAYPNINEFAALDELANREPTEDEIATGDEVGLSLVRQIITEPEKATAFRHRLPWILHAVVGLDRTKAESVKQMLLEQGVPTGDGPYVNAAIAELGQLFDFNDDELNQLIAANYVAAMGKTKAKYSDRLTHLAKALTRMGDALPSDHGRAAAQILVDAIANRSRPEVLAALADALAGLRQHASESQLTVAANALADCLLRGLASDLLLIAPLARLDVRLPDAKVAAVFEEIFSSRYYLGGSIGDTFDDAMGPFAKSLTPEQVSAAAEALLVKVEDWTFGILLVEHLAGVLAGLGPHLSVQEVAEFARRIIAVMPDRPPDRGSKAWGAVLGGLVSGLPADQREILVTEIIAAADELFDQDDMGVLIRVFNEASGTRSDAQVSRRLRRVSAELANAPKELALWDLAEELTALGPDLTQSQAETAAQHIVKAMEAMTRWGHLSNFAEALASLGHRLPPEQAAKAANILIAFMKETKEVKEIGYLADDLGELSHHLPTATATAFADWIVAEISQAGHIDAPSSLASALGSLQTRLPEAQALIGIEEILRGAWNGRGGSGPWSCAAISRLMENLSDEQAAAFAPQIVATMQKPRGRGLYRVLSYLVPRMTPEQIASLLKSTVCVGDVRKAVLVALWWRELDGAWHEWFTPPNNVPTDLWEAVQWAEEQGVDVDAVPRWPLPSQN